MKKVLFLIFCTVLFCTCKKYPEGGFLRQGPKTFITKGNKFWKLSLYEVNGIDSTHLVNIPITFNNDFYETFLDCQYIGNSKKNGLYADNHNYNYLVKFLEKNAKISFENIGLDNSQCINTSSGNSCQRNMFNPEGIGLVIYKILKLKDNECILTTTLNNSYKIILNR